MKSAVSTVRGQKLNSSDAIRSALTTAFDIKDELDSLVVHTG